MLRIGGCTVRGTPAAVEATCEAIARVCRGIWVCGGTANIAVGTAVEETHGYDSVDTRASLEDMNEKVEIKEGKLDFILSLFWWTKICVGLLMQGNDRLVTVG